MIWNKYFDNCFQKHVKKLILKGNTKEESIKLTEMVFAITVVNCDIIPKLWLNNLHKYNINRNNIKWK